MGYGDSLLAAGIAQRMVADHPERGPVTICTCNGIPRWRAEWIGNPAIRQPDGSRIGDHLLPLGGGCLPYHPMTREMTFRARDYPATLYLTDTEQTFADDLVDRLGPFILVEPTPHDRKNRNRCWPGESWRRMVARLLTQVDLPVLQLIRPGADRLGFITGIPHPDFRHACAVLQRATLAILPEGGLAIAAATVGTPAVVLWGGNGSVEHFGFPQHVNLVDADPETPCGRMAPCDHCAAAWARLTPERVVEAALTELQRLRVVARKVAS